VDYKKMEIRAGLRPKRPSGDLAAILFSLVSKSNVSGDIDWQTVSKS
jgi:hypothetical protein